MSEPDDQRSDSDGSSDSVADEPGFVDRARSTAAIATEKAKDVGDRHVSVAVPFRAFERNTGARAVQLMHSLVWNEPPPRMKPLGGSLAFSAAMCVFVAAVSLTWWFRDTTPLGKFLILALMIAPLAGLWLLVSLHLPHGTASWTALLPGAFLVAIGFQVTHGLVVYLLGPKLEHSTSLYGGLGVVATMLFFMYVVGRIVVTAPILNSSLHDELEGRVPATRAWPQRWRSPR